TLHLRRRHPELFGKNASYEPLFARGPRSDHVVAFTRARKVVTIVPRLVTKLGGDWQGTTIDLPSGEFENAFTGERWKGRIEVAELFSRFRVALLAQCE